MSFKKFSWKIFFALSCIRSTTNKNPSKKKSQISKENSLQSRLSLTEASCSSMSLNDLSNSIFFDLHIFTYKELQLITQNFAKSNFLGEGGFGEVYKGFIDDKLRPGLDAQPVAVKALKLDGGQGHREWLAEVIFLGQLKHDHLVKLIGYCWEDEHRLLVYEFMERGNVENHLLKRFGGTLPWLTRIKILLGAAKGLAYLHGEEPPVIYRDFKASNILLDLDYSAKLSDFGLATDGPKGEETHVTTSVMGTEGYAAPEYLSTGQLMTMSDVFSFGVVLLELITGRRAVEKLGSRKQNLVEWARPKLKDPQKLEEIIDPRLEGQYSYQGARKAAALAYRCLSHNPKSRPTMSSVVTVLEHVLDLTDIQSGPFVYVVPNESDNETSVKKRATEEQLSQVGDKAKKRTKDEENKEDKKETVPQRHRGGHRHKRKIKAVYSDSALYKSM